MNKNPSCPIRTDGYVNILNNYRTSQDPSERYVFEPAFPISDEALSAFYEENGLFANIIDAPAEEAVKRGFSVVGIVDQKTEAFYRAALDDLNIEEVFSTAVKWARVFGGALAVMLIDDGRGTEEPLDWNNIHSIDRIVIYDRSLVQPDYNTIFTNDTRNPFSVRRSRLEMPEYYTIFSKSGTFTVHESRCLIFQNGRLPENCTNSVYRFWGMPEYIRIQRAIKGAEISHTVGPKMLQRSIQAVYKMKNLSELLATEEGEDVVLKRLQALELARGLMNSIAIDSEIEDYDFKQISMTGVADVIDCSIAYLSAVSSIPQNILFGKHTKGFASTDDTSAENYYNLIERIQRTMLKKNLHYLLSIIFQMGVLQGKIPDVPPIRIEFHSLWMMTALEEAEIEIKREQTKLIKARTADMYVSMGVITPSEVRKKL